ncbi:hypothetical protein DRQ36_00455 [bacterium]|nr:MAG: hypothetical protein DRQ36_00455 [bacterium]
MSNRKRKIHIYWLQFVIAAVWVGVIEVALSGKVHPKVRAFIVDNLIILTGVLAFQPVGRQIFKYLLISSTASILIQILRELGHLYMSAGAGFWRFGGPVVALAAITVLLYVIGSITNKHRLKL